MPPNSVATTLFDSQQCEREPIHAPASIQAFGYMLILNANNYSILQVSQNLLELLRLSTEELLGQSLSTVFNVNDYKHFMHLWALDNSPQVSHPVSIELAEQWFELTVHREGSLLLLDLEPVLQLLTLDADRLSYRTNTVLEQFCNAQNMNDLLQITVNELQILGSFDRVIAYMFHPDGHGEVLAEVLVPEEPHSYLGLHFPASDIPRQARVLYEKIPVRVIQDVSLEDIPLVPAINPLTGKQAVLTHSVLRGVSLFHKNYMLNMGVATSVSFSLMHDGNLWGLLVCHHRKATPAPPILRAQCLLICQLASLHLTKCLREEVSNQQLQLQMRKQDWLSYFQRQRTFYEVFIEKLPDLLPIFSAQGLVLSLAGQTHKLGIFPLPELLNEIIQEATRQKPGQVFSSSSWAKSASDGYSSIGGYLFTPLSSDGDYLCCFREELVRTYQWSGYQVGSRGPLNPIHSFERWQEEVRGRCQAWTTPECDTAESLQQHVKASRIQEALVASEAQLAYELSERKRLESQLIHAQRMESVGQLAAGVAHEINNPIGFVMSNLSTLIKYITVLKLIYRDYQKLADSVAYESQNDKISQQIKQIRDAEIQNRIGFILDDIDNLLLESKDGTTRVKDIVQGLKSFARLDEAEFKVADINECLDSTLKIAWNELKYKGTVKLDLGNLPEIHCNPSQLNQVFLNLLINAAHAISEDGQIVIRTSASDTHVTVQVSDSGEGIPEENLSKIFDPFFTTKSIGQGTGLGLAISYGIIQKHQGSIEVESELGKGTTFIINLPIQPV